MIGEYDETYMWTEPIFTAIETPIAGRFINSNTTNAMSADLSGMIKTSVSAPFKIGLLAISVFLSFYFLQQIIMFFGYSEREKIKVRKK